MQLESIVLYHRDGVRMHELPFTVGALNVVTGISNTGKSALLEIVDYCLGRRKHGVFRGPELESIGWYGLRLVVDGRSVFVARERPPIGQRSSDRVTLRTGLDAPPTPAEIEQTTNRDTLIDQLSAILGIDENLQAPSDGSAREPVTATIRHAVPYVLQRQRLIADPKYLFAGQDENKEHHIRDTLPFFLGAVDHDALAQRRELRQRRAQLKDATRKLRDGEGANAVIGQRAMLLVKDARETGLIDANVDVEPETVRQILAAAIQSPLGELENTATGDLAAINDLQDRRSEHTNLLRELRAARRTLVSRKNLAHSFTHETREQRARLATLDLLPAPGEEEQAACPLCRSTDGDVVPGSSELRAELERVSAQVAASTPIEPQLQHAIEAHDERISEVRGRLDDIDRELRIVVQRNELARRAKGRLEQQAYVRGRIAGFLDEHPVVDDAELHSLREQVRTASAHVERLEEALGADATRARTENALDYIGSDMTLMAQRLGLSFSADSVRLDPVALTVVGRDPKGPVWLNEDIGSGNNWVGYHLVTALALQRYFIQHGRPVPRFLILDQPTQAFFPDHKRNDPNRKLADMSREDQARVTHIFDLLHDTVKSLDGRLQIIVTDHARVDTPWFEEAVAGRDWHQGGGLVPSDWFE
jgi:hypothetical protein